MADFPEKTTRASERDEFQECMLPADNEFTGFV